MSSFKEIALVWKRVFKNWKYFVLLLISGFIFYMLNGFVLNITNLSPVYRLLGFFGMLQFLFVSSLNFTSRLTLIGTFGITTLSLLVGILVSLLFYRFYTIDKINRKKSGFFGGLGILVGIAAPGCVACGVGLLSLLGLTSALAALPFQGHEVIVIAVILVGFSVVNISRKLYNPLCELKPNGN